MKVWRNEPMAKHTTFKVGGPCDLLMQPETEQELVEAIQQCKATGEPYFVIGNGSNLLVKDAGIRGTVIVISNLYSAVEPVPEQPYMLRAQAGVLLSKLAKTAYQMQLSGLEFASGIPGTLGGGIYMNAGAYGGELSQVIVQTRYYDQERGQVKTLTGEEHEFSYRHSVFQTNKNIILESTLQLKPGNADEIKAMMDDFSMRRKSKQPLEYPSAGSTFKRPEGYFAGKLIEDAGLRGFAIGGAQVSEKHCGFVINRGDATADDILRVIAHVKEEVLRQFGVELEEEVQIL